MLSIGRIFAGDGWRYLWEQVAAGAEDYYLADVSRGETPGRWYGTAAGPELGLAGEVTKEQMHRVFGLLVHPTENRELGRAPRIYRSLDQRLAAARRAHDEAQQEAWNRRAVELAEGRVPMEQVEAEQRAHDAIAAEEWAEREAVLRRGGERHAVAGFDLCFSPPKSVSVLWAAADGKGREVIWGAHREAVAAALGYLEREAAWSRSGYNGIRQIDTTGWVIAGFEHRMSRAGDVQIHTHNAVLNRACCLDGEWRSLDGRAVYRAAASAGALYDRVREAALERDLGVRHEVRKPGGPREIAGIDDDICKLFSSRRVAVEGRLAELADACREQHDGAEPSKWTLTQLARWATLETRPRKDEKETTPKALVRWEAETRAKMGRSLAEVWQRAVPEQVDQRPDSVFRDGQNKESSGSTDDELMVAAAVATVDVSRSTWTRYHLARQLTHMLAADPAAGAETLLERVDHLVDIALGAHAERFGVVDLSAPAVFDTPAELLRRRDGESVYVEHGATRYSTRAALTKEQTLLEVAENVDGPRLDPAQVETVIDTSRLSQDQAAAVRRLAVSGRPIEALVGPAGAT